MEAKGFKFRNPVRDVTELKHVMLEGPDRVLIEIFEYDFEKIKVCPTEAA
jgi:hypothetical protein